MTDNHGLEPGQVYSDEFDLILLKLLWRDRGLSIVEQAADEEFVQQCAR